MMMVESKCLALVSPEILLSGEAYISGSDFLFLYKKRIMHSKYIFMYRRHSNESNFAKRC